MQQIVLKSYCAPTSTKTTQQNSVQIDKWKSRVLTIILRQASDISKLHTTKSMPLW